MNDKVAAVSRAKILLVDAKASDLEAFEQILTDLPADIIKADSTEKALTLISENEVAVILLDAQMAKMNGFEIAEQIRNNRHAESIPIIFVSDPDKEKIHIFKGYQAGAVDYLFKPIEPYLLQSKVQIFLDMYYQQTKRLSSILLELQNVKLKLNANDKRIEKTAEYSVLSELPNKQQFERELDRTLSYSKRHHKKFAIMFLSILGLSNFDDTHDGGTKKELSKQIIIKLCSAIRSEDYLAQFKTDEFSVVLTAIDDYDNAGTIAQKIKELLVRPLLIGSNEIKISVSIGIACYPVAGKTSDELIKNADIAMYRAKRNKESSFEYFSESLGKEYSDKVVIEKALTKALEKNQFYMVYQIIYDLKTLKPIDVEALIRWHHPKLGDVSPEKFIPMCEKLGIIEKIGLWVIEESCKQFSLWEEKNFGLNHYSINISPIQLQQSNFLQGTKIILEQENINPVSLTLELTETAIMENEMHVQNMLRNLADIGFSISVDDFGTGYSSIVRLSQLPLKKLKIDRSFIGGISTSKDNEVIVKSIIALADNLGLKTVAEGVETKSQLKFLVEHGCDYAQGFYLSRPMSADDVSKVFRERKDG